MVAARVVERLSREKSIAVNVIQLMFGCGTRIICVSPVVRSGNLKNQFLKGMVMKKAGWILSIIFAVSFK
jgi:hypothetical protein